VRQPIQQPSMETILTQLCSKGNDQNAISSDLSETKSKQTAVTELETFLQSNDLEVKCHLIYDLHLQDQYVDETISALISSLNGNNYKVSSGALACLESIILQQGENFRPFVNTLLPHILERFGDTKQPVRDKSVDVALSCMKVFVSRNCC